MAFGGPRKGGNPLFVLLQQAQPGADDIAGRAVATGLHEVVNEGVVVVTKGD